VHDVVHIDDLTLLDLKQYKAVVFVNTYVMSREQRAFIRDKVAKQERHLIWVYAPGYGDQQLYDRKYSEEVTGIKLRALSATELVSAVIDSSIVKNYTFTMNKVTITNPLFLIEDNDAKTFARIGSQSALAMKKLKESTSWFLTLPYDNTTLWKFILGSAGAHRYCSDDAIVYGCSGALAIHTKQGGATQLTLMNGKKISLTMPPNSTWLVDDESGEVIYK
jgi:hypothetical protein